MKWKTHDFTEFLFLESLLFVNLISEDDKWNVLKFGHLHELVELGFRLF